MASSRRMAQSSPTRLSPGTCPPTARPFPRSAHTHARRPAHPLRCRSDRHRGVITWARPDGTYDIHYNDGSDDIRVRTPSASAPVRRLEESAAVWPHTRSTPLVAPPSRRRLAPRVHRASYGPPPPPSRKLSAATPRTAPIPAVAVRVHPQVRPELMRALPVPGRSPRGGRGSRGQRPAVSPMQGPASMAGADKVGVRVGLRHPLRRCVHLRVGPLWVRCSGARGDSAFLRRR